MNKHHTDFNKNKNSGSVIAAAVLICLGVLFLGRNLSFISSEWFHFLISWPSWFIFFGVIKLVKRKYFAALVLILVGLFYLLPEVWNISFEEYSRYWPVFLIIGGIGMLFDIFKPEKKYGRYGENNRLLSGNIDSNDGFVSSYVNFKGARCIFQEPVFKGARLDVSFGSILLDLRKARLEAPLTYIDISSSFSGVELYIPSSWKVIIETNSSFGAVEDKRYASYEIDYEHKLIIRGSISFGGIEIKS